MKKPEISKAEVKRLRELDAYDIINAAEEDDYDFLTSMAAEICGTKISLISLVTKDKQCFLSHHGLDVRETSKDFSFCAHAINIPDKPFVIEDARKDPRFFDNPLTTGYPHVIFYAGIPLVNRNGFPLGSLCVIDDKPSKLSDKQIIKLQHLAKQVVKLLELRRSQIELIRANEELEQFAYTASHDLQSPLITINGLINLLEKKEIFPVGSDLEKYFSIIKSNVQRMKLMTFNLLEYAKIDGKKMEFEEVSLNEVCQISQEMIHDQVDVNKAVFSIPDLPKVIGDKIQLTRLFQNLFSNAIKYRSDAPPEIDVGFEEKGDEITVFVGDNGMGFDQHLSDQVFGFMKRLHSHDSIPGTGIGLSACKRIVENHGGAIWAKSETGKGSTFYFTLTKTNELQKK